MIAYAVAPRIMSDGKQRGWIIRKLVDGAPARGWVAYDWDYYDFAEAVHGANYLNYGAKADRDYAAANA